MSVAFSRADFNSSVSPGNIETILDLGIMYLKVNEVTLAYEKLQEANGK